MLTASEENHLKAIYKISQNNSDKTVFTKAIAEELNTNPASVTDMVKKLADKKLLTHEKYYGVQLTREGQRLQ